MTITTDILRSWRRPRTVIREKLAAGEREDRALAVLMGASLLLFVAQWPSLSRAAFLDPTTPLEARLGGALLACLFILPLLAYGIAAISHLIARALGGKGTGFGARLALFWAMLAIAPAMLLQGLTAGFIGASPALWLVQTLVLVGFLWIWLSMMIQVERTK
jgi:hypothetical protein